jgi:hypothetical protein
MSTKTQYSDADWRAIAAAPVAAGLLISLSDACGSVGIAREALAVEQAIARTASGDAPEIVKALAEKVRRGRGRLELPDIPAGDREQAKDALLDALKTAVSAVQRASPGEVEGYKTWLASVTAKVAHASKAGHVLRDGGALVGPDEQEAVNQLADVLGVGGRQPELRSRRGRRQEGV